MNVWLPLECPLLGTWPTTKGCALTGNQTDDSLVPRPALYPLSHTNQGLFLYYYYLLIIVLFSIQTAVNLILPHPV